MVVLKAWPADLLSFDDVDRNARMQRNFDGGAGNFSVAHSGMSIAHIKQRSGNVHRQIQGIAGAGFGGVHVAAELCRYDRAARLAIGGCYSYAAKERMERNFDGEIRVQRLEGRGIVCMIDGKEPDFF